MIINGRAIIVVTLSGIPSGGTPSGSTENNNNNNNRVTACTVIQGVASRVLASNSTTVNIMRHLQQRNVFKRQSASYRHAILMLTIVHRVAHIYTWPESRVALSLNVAELAYIDVHQVGHHHSLDASCSRPTGLVPILLNPHRVVLSCPIGVKVYASLCGGVCM